MATQLGAPSPQNPDEQNSFIIRTMQDDLNGTRGVATSSFQSAPETIPRQAPPVFESQKNLPQESSFPKETFPIEVESEIKEIPISQDVPTPRQLPSSKMLFIAITVFIVCIITISGFYFWSTRTPEQVSIIENPPITEPAPIVEEEEPPVIIAPPVEKYSQEKPNFLTLNIATLTAADIKNSIIQVAEELKLKSSQQPYEFIVVDGNNNPISFPIFATAASLQLNPAILSSLGSNFSLFLFNDNGNVRLAISTVMINKETVASLLLKQEPTLPVDAAFLFLNAIPDIKTGSFGSGTYKNFSIRYFNANVANNLSIDYSINGTQLVIGTSKNTERAVLDKLTKETAIKNSNASLSASDDATLVNSSTTE